MNIQAYLLLAVALSLLRCGTRHLRIGAPALGQFTPQDRGDVTSQNQFAMVVYPEATGLGAASTYYLQQISTFIDRSTTDHSVQDPDRRRDNTYRHVCRVQLGQRRSQRLDGRCSTYL